MIKKYLKNIIFAILGNALVAELIYFLTIKKTNKLYVINYHKTYYKHSENFKKQLIYLKKKFQIIDENYLLNFFYTKKKLTNKPKLLITFDDGHISNYIVASKILDNLNIKGIFFIPTEYINRKTKKNLKQECKESTIKYSIPCDFLEEKKNNWKRVSMTWRIVRKLKKKGHSIGCHGFSHQKLSNKLSMKTLENEIIKSKKIIEKKIQSKIFSFSWIGGEIWSYSKVASQIIENAKYRFSLMTCCYPSSQKDSPMKIHKFNIENYFCLNQVRATLFGFYSLLYFYKRRRVNNIINTKKN